MEVIEIISALSGFVGAFGGILISTKLNNYRIDQLEKKVDKHNEVITRTYVLEEKMKVTEHRIEDLEHKVP